MAVLVGALAPRDTVADGEGGATELAGAWGVQAFEAGGRSYAYVAGTADAGLTGFRVGADGTLTVVENVADTAGPGLLTPTRLVSATFGGRTFLYVGSNLGNAVTVFEVDTSGGAGDGALRLVQTVFDVSGLELLGVVGRLSVAEAGGTSVLVVSGAVDNGVTAFRIDPATGRLVTGTPAPPVSVDDGADAAFELAGALDTATAVAGGRSFVFVAGNADDGVTSFELGADGSLTFRDSVDDGEDAALELDGAMGLATVTVGSATYLVASGYDDDGLGVFEVGSDGSLTLRDSLYDAADPALALDAPLGLSTFSLGGETFVAVSSSGEGGALSVFHLGAGGALTLVQTLRDDPTLGLGLSFDNAFLGSGGCRSCSPPATGTAPCPLSSSAAARTR